MVMKNDFNYKWSKIFASKRYNTKDGVIKLTPEEQQELLDDSERVVKKCSTPNIRKLKGTVLPKTRCPKCNKYREGRSCHKCQQYW